MDGENSQTLGPHVSATRITLPGDLRHIDYLPSLIESTPNSLLFKVLDQSQRSTAAEEPHLVFGSFDRHWNLQKHIWGLVRALLPQVRLGLEGNPSVHVYVHTRNGVDPPDTREIGARLRGHISKGRNGRAVRRE